MNHVRPKAILKVHFVKNPYYSTFHLLIMLWIRDQSGRNLSVLEINGFCGYLNPRSPLECNSLGKNSFPDFLPLLIHNTGRAITQHQTCMMSLFGLNILVLWNTELFLSNCPPSDGFLVSIVESQALPRFLPVLHAHPSFLPIRFKLKITYKDAGTQTNSKTLSRRQWSVVLSTQALWSERSGFESWLCCVPHKFNLFKLWFSYLENRDKSAYFKRDCWEDWWNKTWKASASELGTSSSRDQELFIAPALPYSPDMGPVHRFCILLQVSCFYSYLKILI